MNYPIKPRESWYLRWFYCRESRALRVERRGWSKRTKILFWAALGTLETNIGNERSRLRVVPSAFCAQFSSVRKLHMNCWKSRLSNVLVLHVYFELIGCLVYAMESHANYCTSLIKRLVNKTLRKVYLVMVQELGMSYTRHSRYQAVRTLCGVEIAWEAWPTPILQQSVALF